MERKKGIIEREGERERERIEGRWHLQVSARDDLEQKDLRLMMGLT